MFASWGKTHKYKKRTDVEHMTPLEILNINPDEISVTIVDDTSQSRIDPNQMAALRCLIANKKAAKDIRDPAIKQRMYQTNIEQCKSKLGYKLDDTARAVNELLVDATAAHSRSEARTRMLDDRLRALKSQLPRIKTEEEKLDDLLLELDDESKGGSFRKRRTYRRRGTYRRKRTNHSSRRRRRRRYSKTQKY